MRSRTSWIIALIALLPPAHLCAQSPSPSSPIIDWLGNLNDLARPAAVQRFWAEREGNGPLIEPSTRRGFSLVTFVFRDAPGVRTVALETPLGALLARAGEPLDQAGRLRLVPGTDIWALTIEARNDLRTAYHFVIADASPRPRHRPDPNNPNRFAPDTPEEGSLLQLPAAPAQPWTSSTSPRGRWERTSMTGRDGHAHDVFIYYPPGYDAHRSRPYPVLVAQHSIEFGLEMPVARIADLLIANRDIPPLLIVTTEEGGEGVEAMEALASHLRTELLPWLRVRANAARDPAQIAIAGASQRGLSAAYVAWKHPDIARGVLSLSGAFYWAPPADAEPEWLTRQIATSRERTPLRFFLAAGELETVATVRNQGLYPLATTRHLRDVLEAARYPVCYSPFYGGHGAINWQDSIAAGLRCLFAARHSQR